MRLVDDLFIQYDVLITTIRNEIDSLGKEVNARWLSRTGFVFEEMRLAEARLRSDIGDRSAVIGPDSECIDEAVETLDTAVEIAGNGSFDVHSTVLRELNMYRYLYVYPLLSQMKRMVSAYETQPTLVFFHENPVVNFEGILANLIAEFDYLNSQFEPFVDDVIHQLERFTHYTNTQSEVLFTTLDAIHNTFNSRLNQANQILAQC